ncbi:MAG: hypothetical protein HQK51_07580 [Oligoflexia bacterium]|nr:hypothetical protein [Oligoflexia bacterium]
MIMSLREEINNVVSGKKYDVLYVDTLTIALFFREQDTFDNAVSYLMSALNFRKCIDIIKFQHHKNFQHGLILLDDKRNLRIIVICYQEKKYKIPSMIKYFHGHDYSQNHVHDDYNTTSKTSVCILKNGEIVLNAQDPVYESHAGIMAPTMSWYFLWNHFFEHFFDLDTPISLKAIKVVICELERVNNHIQSILNTVKLFGGRCDFEKDNDVFEIVKFCYQVHSQLFASSLQCNCDHNCNTYDLTFAIFESPAKISYNLLNKMLNFTCRLRKLTDELQRNIFTYHLNYKLKEKIDCNYNCKELIGKTKLSGPILRALSVNYDIRKIFPYLLYDQIDFDVSLGTSMSFKDILNVKFAEIKESLNIINLIVKNFPPIEMQYNLSNVMDKIHEQIKLENFLNNFENKLIYKAFESPEGEIGISAVVTNVSSFSCSKVLFKMDMEYKIRSAIKNNQSALNKFFLELNFDSDYLLKCKSVFGP